MKGVVLAGKIKGGDGALWGFELAERWPGLLLVAGERGSGRTTLLYHLYRQILEKHTPRQVGFVFIGPTDRDFAGWPPEYLFYPPAITPTAGFMALQQLKREMFGRTVIGGWRRKRRGIVVHIEVDDLTRKDHRRLERLLLRLGRYVIPGNMLIIVSSQDTSVGVTNNLLRLTSSRILHELPTQAEYDRVSGVIGHQWRRGTGERFGVTLHHTQPILPLDQEYVVALQRWAANGFSRATWPEDPLLRAIMADEKIVLEDEEPDVGGGADDEIWIYAFFGLIAGAVVAVFMYFR